jgi:hypothetical protein
MKLQKIAGNFIHWKCEIIIHETNPGSTEFKNSKRYIIAEKGYGVIACIGT